MKSGLSFLAFVLIGLSGFSQTAAEERFSIFLPKKTISESMSDPVIHGGKKYSQHKIGDLDVMKIPLKDSPLISEEDVIGYSKSSHSIQLSIRALAKVLELNEGTVVFICLDRKPIYWGIIWSDILSISASGVIVLKPSPLDLEMNPEYRTIKIKKGYPTPEWFRGKDPRNNPEIFKSLKKAGKLIE